MISHTDAFKTYRDLSQAHLNFAVLVCHSVPAFSASLTAAGALTVPPDYFKAPGNPIDDLISYAAAYQEELARSAVITIYSYFEAYVGDMLREIVDFHAGKEAIKGKARDRAERFFHSMPDALQEDKRKLQDRRDPRKIAKYQKHGRVLDKKGFRFPTDLLAHYGALNLIKKADEKNGFKAHEIPSILEDALLYPLSPGDKITLELIRLKRNSIAHGEGTVVALSEAMRHASELHTIAAAVDSHVANHFLVLQEL